MNFEIERKIQRYFSILIDDQLIKQTDGATRHHTSASCYIPSVLDIMSPDNAVVWIAREVRDEVENESI